MTDHASDLADKLAIAELAQIERLARDRNQWELMADSYISEGSRVFLSWFDGDAGAFIAASRAMNAEPGGPAIHSNGPTLVELNGDRALAETPCAILFRRVFDGVECDMTAYCRHHSRVVRVGGLWRLCTLVGVYEKNTLTPVVPGVVPEIDTEVLAGLRPSYNYQTYLRAQQGKRFHDDRPGIDRPDLVDRFLTAERRWLAGEDVPLGVVADG
jgi:hypothetical protein